MTDVEGRGDARVTEDRYTTGGFEDVVGTVGIGDEDEHRFVEDRIESSADGTDLGLFGKPSAVDGRYDIATGHHHAGFDIDQGDHLRWG
ncbi:hypothetical protein GCM10009690_33430 [Brevibacterium permense]|uniref:Uncharacterized protein n=1 Tax=Brevibacterium permense TaxID=234834 RepID=A0ABN2AV74_9MICO